MSDKITWGGGQEAADGSSAAMLKAGIIGTIAGSIGLLMLITVLPNTLKAYFKRGELPYAANYLLLFISATLPGTIFMAWLNAKDFFDKAMVIIVYGVCSLIMVKLLSWLADALISNGFTWAPGNGALRQRLGIDFSLREKLGSLGGVGAWLGRVFAPPAPVAASSAAELPAMVREGEAFLRGTKIVAPQHLGALIASQHSPADLEYLAQIGGVPFPFKDEVKNLVLPGRPGSGKSQIFYRLIRTAQKRGNPAMVADAAGGFYSRFGRSGVDLLLNPLDGRSVDWSPFAEIREVHDCLRIAKAAIPDAPGDGKQWSGYAQTLFADVLLALWEKGEQNTKTLLWYVQAAEVEELKALIGDDKPASVLLKEGNDRMLGNTRASAGLVLGAWRYLPEIGKFSIRQWVRDNADQRNGGWLYVTHRDDQIELRNLVAMAFDLAMIETMTLSESNERRFWFFLDEVDSLGRVNSLVTFASKGRKYGSALVLAPQAVSQMRSNYGKDDSDSIFGCCASRCVMSQAGVDSAEYWSKTFGEQELTRWEESTGNNTGMGGGGMNLGKNSGMSQRTVTQAAVMPSELVGLQDLHGVLAVSGYPVTKIVVEYLSVPQQNEAFVPVGRA